MKRRLFVGLAAGVILLAMAAVTQASSITIFSNFGPGDTFNGNFAADPGPGNSAIANAFTAPTTLINAGLKSIEVAIVNPRNNYGANLINVSLFDDRGGNPGTLLESFDIALDPSYSDRIYEATSLLNPSLVAGAQYWLVASAPGSSLAWNWNGMAPFATPTGLSLREYDGAAWQDSSQLGQQAFRVSAIDPVPEPASLLLLGTGLIGAVRAARRKRG